jgi:hypothetical protein
MSACRRVEDSIVKEGPRGMIGSCGLISKVRLSRVLTPVTLATWEAEIRRIAV